MTASIVRENAQAEASLQVENLSGQWRLFVGSPAIDYGAPLLCGQGSGLFPLSLPDDQWLYFCLQSQNGQVFFAEKKLPLEGAYNFRDMGGFIGQQGRQVVWGKLFRADDMMELSKRDLRYLASIPITSIVDFRTSEEMDWAPDRKPPGLKNYFQYHVLPGGISGLNLETSSGLSADEFMAKIYCNLVLDEGIIAVYSEFFQRIMEADKLPLLFHCSAGKDRTGWAAAMVLYALGVDEKIIMHDYMLSAQYIRGKYPPGNDRFTVKPQFLQAGLEQAKRSYGSIAGYLREALRVDTARLQAMYLF